MYDIFPYFYIVVTAISLTVHGSIQITAHEYPHQHYTQHKHEEHFTDGCTIATVLQLAADSSNIEVRYSTEELHTSGSWDILAYSISHRINRNM